MKCLLVALILTVTVVSVQAHESWINSGKFVGKDGLPCCGENDCFIIPGRQVKITKQGYKIWLSQVVSGHEALKFETVPYSEAQKSPDGLYWRCRRPDGLRRCFFAPPGMM